MADVLAPLTDFILHPAPELMAGAALFGAVWGFFKGVDAMLNDKAKHEVASWLLGIGADQIERWSVTFIKIFDRVFGGKHLSWQCFGRSAIASFATVAVCVAITWFAHGNLSVTVTVQRTVYPFPREEILVPVWTHVLPYYTLLLNVLPDYIT